MLLVHNLVARRISNSYRVHASKDLTRRRERSILESMAPPILTHLEGRYPVACHEHVAVFYRGRSNAYRFASFLAEGLVNGDICHYLAPENLHAQMLAALQGLLSPAGDLQKSHSLALLAGHDNFTLLREYLRQAFALAERRRVPALRWLEEAEWTTSANFPLHHFFEFHSILNLQVKHYPSAVLCQYDLDAIEPLHLFSTIAVHRHLLVEDAYVRDNPFYVPPEKYLPMSLAERNEHLKTAFREFGLNTGGLLEALRGYGGLHSGAAEPA